jgi:hypothetical protein
MGLVWEVATGVALRERVPKASMAYGCLYLIQSHRLWAPPNTHLPPSNPLSAPPGQRLALRNQTLMDRAGRHRDAVPADLVAEMLTGDANARRMAVVTKELQHLARISIIFAYLQK